MLLAGLIVMNYLFTIKKDTSLFSYVIFGVVTAIVILVIVKLLFIKQTKIKGLYTSRETYKRLWDIVDLLTTKFKGIKIHKVVIIDKCKLDIVTQYKFGLWGKKKVTLVIGLPIILGFSEKEVEMAIGSVICKNSKNLKRKDRRIRKTYLKLESLFDEEKNLIKSNMVFDSFMKPILKKFYMYYKNIAFVSVRESILDADKIFLSVYTENNMSEIILKKYVHKYLVEKVFLKKINKSIEETGESPENLYTLINEYLNEHVGGRDIVEALKVLKLSDKKELSFIGTPIDRIEKTRYRIDYFQYEFGDNAVRLLGKNFEKIIKKFNSISFKESKEIWNMHSKKILKEKEVYDNLCRLFAMFNLPEEEFDRYMTLREKFSGVNTAIIEGKKLCIAYQHNSLIRYKVGKMLLSGNNVQGVEYIKQAIKLNPFVSIDGYKDIINYYIRIEGYEAALIYEKEYDSLKIRCKEGLKEREKPKLKASYYTKVDLEKETLSRIKNVLEGKSFTKKAYISKLKVERFEYIPHYILWVNYKLNFFTMEETLRGKDQEIKNDISLDNITVLHLNGDNFYMKFLLKRMKKSKIFNKAK